MIVMNKGGHIRIFGKLTCMPGSNTFADEDWRDARTKFPKIGQLCKPNVKFPNGELVEVDGQTISDLPSPRAVQVALECADGAQLAKWRAGETRPEVLEAIALAEEAIRAQRAASAEKAAARKKSAG